MCLIVFTAFLLGLSRGQVVIDFSEGGGGSATAQVVVDASTSTGLGAPGCVRGTSGTITVSGVPGATDGTFAACGADQCTSSRGDGVTIVFNNVVCNSGSGLSSGVSSLYFETQSFHLRDRGGGIVTLAVFNDTTLSSCTAITDPAICEASGCTFSGTCQKLACGSIFDEDSCNEAFDCEWSLGACMDSSKKRDVGHDCGRLKSPFLCLDQREHCEWDFVKDECTVRDPATIRRHRSITAVFTGTTSLSMFPGAE